MTRPSGPGVAPVPVTARCIDRYAADLIPAFGFVFHVTATRTQFTVYATTADAYRLGMEYTVFLTPGRATALPLTEETTSVLRNVLNNVANRLQEAITDARAGAARPAEPRTAEPGHLDIEPTPAGYHTIGRLFAEELDRVERVLRLLDQVAVPEADGSPS